MFNYTELKKVHLEITNNCQASCPMCSRNIHGGLINPLIKINNWSFEDFKKIFDDKLLLQLEHLNFCGNFGEPILNNDLLKMCSHAKTINPNISVTIHTNGSARSEKWWIELQESLPINHNVIFAIDGLEDTHEIYRIGTNYNTIINNAKTFIKHGGNAEWAFIRFQHNLHQEKIAESLAKEYGFKKFRVKESKRFGKSFPVVDKFGKKIYSIEQPHFNSINFITKEIIKDNKNWSNANDINCFAKNDKELYIDANYIALPCCMIGGVLHMNSDSNILKANNLYHENDLSDYIFDVQQQINNFIGELRNLNVLENTIENILTDDWVKFWEDKWAKKESSTCIVMCTPKTPFMSISNQTKKVVQLIDNV